MMNQTIPTDDFVLVCDGPLTPELDATIAELQQSMAKRFARLGLRRMAV